MKVAQRLKWLTDNGCSPSIYYRGNVWRAHVNQAGNFWADGETPQDAIEDAVKLWVKKGKPMDGISA